MPCISWHRAPLRSLSATRTGVRRQDDGHNSTYAAPRASYTSFKYAKRPHSSRPYDDLHRALSPSARRKQQQEEEEDEDDERMHNISDANLRRNYGEAARAIVERDYSSVRVGSDLVALYRRLLSGVAPSRAAEN